MGKQSSDNTKKNIRLQISTWRQRKQTALNQYMVQVYVLVLYEDGNVNIGLRYFISTMILGVCVSISPVFKSSIS